MTFKKGNYSIYKNDTVFNSFVPMGVQWKVFRENYDIYDQHNHSIEFTTKRIVEGVTVNDFSYREMISAFF